VDHRQKRAASVISLLLVVAASAFFLWLAIDVLVGRVRGVAQPARFFMLMIADWDVASVAFKSLPLLISAGLAALGVYKAKDWLFYAIVGVSVVGFLSSGYLLFEVASVETAKRFWAYSPSDSLQDYVSFVRSARTGLGAMVSWFVGVILIELGIRKTLEQ
jgi:hypothetical protein